MNLQDLTVLCHHLIRPYLAIGATVVDATAGNGHDTILLRWWIRKGVCMRSTPTRMPSPTPASDWTPTAFWIG